MQARTTSPLFFKARSGLLIKRISLANSGSEAAKARSVYRVSNKSTRQRQLCFQMPPENRSIHTWGHPYYYKVLPNTRSTLGAQRSKRNGRAESIY